jgi:hypothetical protein
MEVMEFETTSCVLNTSILTKEFDDLGSAIDYMLTVTDDGKDSLIPPRNLVSLPF